MVGHDPVPDGKHGPWRRKPHVKGEDGLYLYDPRCGRCQAIAEVRSFTAGTFSEHVKNLDEVVREDQTWIS